MLSAPAIEEYTVTHPVPHLPVLARETVDLLAPRPGATLVDGTLGFGGHAERLLSAVGPQGRVYGIDRDPRALELAGQRLAPFGDAFVPVRGKHEDLLTILGRLGETRVDGILLDLGVSSMQIDEADRGFSFREDGPLDMRMDPENGETAAELIARLTNDELWILIRNYGEEKRAGAIAREIVRVRAEQPIVRTGQLATLVERVLGPAARRFRIHPATRTFQALRIAVNGEIAGLSQLVTDAVRALSKGGRLVIIAYHSLEDRPVKVTLRQLANPCTCPADLPICGCGQTAQVRLVGSQPVRPTDEEIESNSRARSARLRVAEKLSEAGQP
jgi:16S rRNA (cytosine1402-N4)-methyltransferase